MKVKVEGCSNAYYEDNEKEKGVICEVDGERCPFGFNGNLSDGASACEDFGQESFESIKLKE